MFEIEYRTAKTITEVEVTESVELGNILRKETHPNDPPQLPETQIQQLKNLPDFFEIHVWLVRHNNLAVGIGNLQIMNVPDNKHMAQLNLQILPEYRQQGLGKTLLEQALQVAREANRTLLICESNDQIPAGAAFLERYSFTPGLEAHVNQLDVSTLKTHTLEHWIQAGKTRAVDYELGIWDGAIPELELPAFVKIMEVMNNAPTGDLEIEDQHLTPEMIREIEKLQLVSGGKRLISYVKHKPSNQLVGFTELIWKQNRASIVSQGNTGVDPTHRGHGLGKWLKAANLEHMLRLNPEAKFVRTGNADSNTSMLKINVELGFKPYFAAIAWQGKTDTILEKLEAQSLSLA